MTSPSLESHASHRGLPGDDDVVHLVLPDGRQIYHDRQRKWFVTDPNRPEGRERIDIATAVLLALYLTGTTWYPGRPGGTVLDTTLWTQYLALTEG